MSLYEGDTPPFTELSYGVVPEDNSLSHTHMYEYWKAGLIGSKEFRNFLAKISDSFDQVRDQDIDNEIDRMARERAEEIRRQMEALRGQSVDEIPG